jgi:hypothetical protein
VIVAQVDDKLDKKMHELLSKMQREGMPHEFIRNITPHLRKRIAEQIVMAGLPPRLLPKAEGDENSLVQRLRDTAEAMELCHEHGPVIELLREAATEIAKLKQEARWYFSREQI